MWAVCYGVAGEALLLGEIINESNGNITIKDSNRMTWQISGWDGKYVDKFELFEDAQKAYKAIYRYATNK